MKRTLIILLAALIICVAFTSCNGSDNGNEGMVQIPGMGDDGLASAMLIFDSSFGDGRESFTQELFMSDVGIYPDDIVEALDLLTGLNFAVKISYDDGIFIVEWRGESDVFSAFNAVSPREEFSFANVEALRWFMLDSLWHTLMMNFPEVSVTYFVTNHIHDTIVEPSPFNYAEPFKGSPFYTEGRGASPSSGRPSNNPSDGSPGDSPSQTPDSNDDDIVFSNMPYHIGGNANNDALTVNLENGDLAVFDAENFEVNIYGFEFVGNDIHVLDESGSEDVIVFTITVINKHTLQRNDTGEMYRVIGVR